MICRESSSAVDDWEPPPSSRTQLVDENRRKRDEALEELYRLSESGQIDPGLDYLYKTIDDLLLDEQYATCDAYLQDMDLERLDSDILVGLLTITFSARHDLLKRSNILEAIREMFRSIMPEAEVSATLRGLDG